MAVYKVLQDIEAEDKFLGPLTLRQFIYGAVAAVAAYISFIGLTKGVWLLLVILLPVILFGGFLAWPWSKDQPNEVWLLAKVRFALKPRRRIWDQTGMKQLVSITVPKKVEQHLTNGLSQTEVQSRLKALAQTIDSRGWAIKNVTVNMFSQPSYLADQDSDRLIDLTSLPQTVPGEDIVAADDILDERNNPTAHHFEELISAASSAQRQSAVSRMQQAADTPPATAAPTSANWFVSPASATTTSPSADEQQALLQKIHQDQAQPDPAQYHTRIAAPQPSSSPANTKPPADTTDTKLLKLAANDDFNVATIARQANQTNKQSGDEVIIPLR